MNRFRKVQPRQSGQVVPRRHYTAACIACWIFAFQFRSGQALSTLDGFSTYSPKNNKHTQNNMKTHQKTKKQKNTMTMHCFPADFSKQTNLFLGR